MLWLRKSALALSGLTMTAAQLALPGTAIQPKSLNCSKKASAWIPKLVSGPPLTHHSQLKGVSCKAESATFCGDNCVSTYGFEFVLGLCEEDCCKCYYTEERCAQDCASGIPSGSTANATSCVTGDPQFCGCLTVCNDDQACLAIHPSAVSNDCEEGGSAP